MGADRSRRKLRPNRHVVPRHAAGARPGTDPRDLLRLEIGEAFGRPRRHRGRLLEETARARLLGEVPHGGRPLRADRFAALVRVQRVAAAEHRRAGELRVGDLVTVKSPLDADQIAGSDVRPIEPPFVSAEDHVRAGDAAHDRRTGPVADVAADCERLWRDDSPESCLCREHVVVVERVRVLHALHPTADVVRDDGLFELPPADGLAEMTVDVRRVQRDPRLLDLGHVPCSPSRVAPVAPARPHCMTGLSGRPPRPAIW